MEAFFFQNIRFFCKEEEEKRNEVYDKRWALRINYWEGQMRATGQLGKWIEKETRSRRKPNVAIFIYPRDP